ncbi:MAG: DUF423 domain-containing protein [Gemmatimonadetes bacterium]|jgi:uncharacterized membrane protein YgdD (TMEM256/DUF423 family)|nr:DUF423 domain-containing protein [Gemmatimonadota bacterium]MBT4608786.1 DUF423 domain-containing protein [Gemmatimonadota bacterium]MBT5056760.1 DUF423 domain-containing protein [Gemmatimonadota bacterium]MBT5146662.1 DUF423 domain-containing protein [Gemmatimonadota bacterium]MBT5587911.1 DUF423 domain-containing protein [Gemmatimonadota bacterium]
MTDTSRLFICLGAIAMATAVALGAFGAHALRARLEPADLAIWHTAVQYHLIHALGLFAVAGVTHLLPEVAGPRMAGWLMLAGILLFSGSLYVLVLTGSRWLGAVTPLGGAAFIAAWVLVAFSAWRT